MEKDIEMLVIGGGLVGASTALAFADAGWKVCHCAPPAERKDTRTTAFLWQSVQFFERLGVWSDLASEAFPLKTMRILDGTDRLIRTPQVEFHSREIDLDAFGYNVINWKVIEKLNHLLERHEAVDRIEAPVKSLTTTDNGFEVVLEDGSQLFAKQVVGADGRNSIVRQSLFPDVSEWSYPQEAIVLDFEHEYPTNFVSTEIHTKAGPFTIVPQSSNKAGLVWMERPERVSDLLSLSTSEIELELEKKMQSFLGKITLSNEPRSFPIKGMVATCFGEGSGYIVGEAAHVFPPIGAQGFNLGVRDVETLIDVMKRFSSPENSGLQYNLLRRSDIGSRTLGVDLLNRSLLSDFLPNQLMRSAGIHALSGFGPLRRVVMKQGISPVQDMSG